MIQEEFSRLIDMYQLAAEGKGGSVQDLLQKSLEFIEHLKQELTTGDEEDRKAAIRMMDELHKFMQEHAKIIAKSSGLTEEEFKANTENPANFTPEQWRNMQESNQKLASAGEELIQLLQPKTPSSPEEKPPGPASPPSTPQEKKGPGGKKPKKSNWMRS